MNYTANIIQYINTETANSGDFKGFLGHIQMSFLGNGTRNAEEMLVL